MQNRISAEFTPAQRTAFDDALAAMQDALPFLHDLSPQERKELYKLGDKSRTFVLAARDAARQFPEVLPAGFDVAAFEEDVDLFEALSEPFMALRNLFERLDDTRMTAGVDAMSAARIVYHYVKGYPGSAALNETAAALGQRFIRKTAPSDSGGGPA